MKSARSNVICEENKNEKVNINRIHLVCVSFPIKLYVCCFEDNFLCVCVCVCVCVFRIYKIRIYCIKRKKLAGLFQKGCKCNFHHS